MKHLTLLLFLALPAYGQVAPFVFINPPDPATVDTAATIANYGILTSYNLPFTVSATANFLAVFNLYYPEGGEVPVIDSVKWGSQQMTMIADTGNIYHQAAWHYLLNPTPGADTVKVYWSDTTIYRGTAAVSFRSVNTSTPIGPYNIMYIHLTGNDSIWTTVAATPGDLVVTGYNIVGASPPDLLNPKNYSPGETVIFNPGPARTDYNIVGTIQPGATSTFSVAVMDSLISKSSAISFVLKQQ